MKRKNKIYLIILSATISLGALATGIFNYIIDPYWIFSPGGQAGFNKIKPEAPRNERLHKAYALRRLKPDGLILGSSRAAAGLDPRHPALKSRFYNGALSGARLPELLSYLRHAQAAAPLKEVILQLDFYMFNNRRNKTELGFRSTRMRFPGDSKRFYFPAGYAPEDLMQTLFSLDGFNASLRTLKKQRPRFHRMTEHGLYTDNLMLQSFAKYGTREAFRLIEENYLRVEYTPYNLFKKDGGSPTLETLDEMIRFCRKHKIKLTLLITPIHTRLSATIKKSGQWKTYQLWKRELVKRKGPSVRLWDFSGFHQLNREKVPDKDAPMLYYWDGGHYTVRLGNMVLERMFGAVGAPSDFGVLLTPANIEKHLEKEF